jgi:hypothetical protein
MRPSAAKIQEQIDLSFDKDFGGMTYAEGVRAALDWVTGESDEPPMAD